MISPTALFYKEEFIACHINFITYILNLASEFAHAEIPITNFAITWKTPSGINNFHRTDSCVPYRMDTFFVGPTLFLFKILG